MADEVYQGELDKLDPLYSTKVDQDIEKQPLPPFQLEAVAENKNIEGVVLTPATDLFAPIAEEDVKEEVFLINTDEQGNGQERLKINPELLKKIKIPPLELNWWERLVAFIKGLFA